MHWARILLIGTAAAAFYPGSIALAQDKPAAGPETRDESDIVVTAEKREARLQDVPLAVAALSAETLTQRNQSRIQDFFATVPGLNLTSAGNGFTNISVRGVTSAANTNPVVGVVIDDVPYGSSNLLGLGARLLPDLDPSDLARIEVLRGPQGTLYGASSIGGLLKYVTAEPSTTAVSGRVEANVNSVAGGETGYGFRGSINLPLADTLAVRASGFTRRDAGYVDNLTTGRSDVNRVDVKGGHLALLWRPVSDVSVKLSALLQNNSSDGTGEVDSSYTLKPISGDLQQTRLAGTGPYDIKVRLYSAVVNADLGGVTLSSITGYGINKYKSSIDVSDAYGDFAALFFGPNVTATALENAFTTKKFSQELRLSSSGNHLFDWVVGGFYTHEKTDTSQTLDPIDPSTGLSAGNFYREIAPYDFREYSGFGDLTVKFTERFNVQFGARYSRNKQTFVSTDTGALVGGETIVTPSRSKDHAMTYLVTPQFKVSRDLMAYARFATGYRVGGPNPGAILGFPATYNPDKTTNYELGLKGTLFDRQLSYTIAAYHIDWKDIQLFLRDADSGFAYYRNGGKAKSEGLELSLDARPAQGLSISANGTYNVAELTQALPAGAGIGADGDRLPYSSRFSASLAIDQDVTLSARATGFVGATLVYAGARQGEFAPSSGELRVRLPAYVSLDLRAGVRQDGWTVSAYLSNVGDRRGVLGGSLRNLRGVATADAAYTVTYIQPRTVGLSVAKAF